MVHGLWKKAVSAFARKTKKYSRQNMYADLDSELSRVPDSSRVLNIGSGGDVAARIARLLGTRPVQVSSMDIDPGRGPDIVGDVCAMSFPDNSWDVIVCLEVLEHVIEPWKAVEEMNRVLKPGGQLIMTTPFIYPVHDATHDYYRFTKHGLRYLLRGFREVRITERNTYIASIDVLLLRSVVEPGRRSKVLAMIWYYSGFSFLTRSIWSGIMSQNLTTGYRVLAVK